MHGIALSVFFELAMAIQNKRERPNQQWHWQWLAIRAFDFYSFMAIPWNRYPYVQLVNLQVFARLSTAYYVINLFATAQLLIYNRSIYRMKSFCYPLFFIEKVGVCAFRFACELNNLTLHNSLCVVFL